MASHIVSFNCLDIVATQGAYLVSRPHTPVFEEAYHETFLEELDLAFGALDVEIAVRRNKYREAADEWLAGHTPIEVRERRLAELKLIEEMEDITSNDGSGSDDGNEATIDDKARLEKTRPATEQASWTQKGFDLDIVRTQGAYLIPRSHTPVFEEEYHEKFPAALDRALRGLNIRMLVRRKQYREDADEWPLGHTPPELRERRLAELKIIEEMEDITSDEDSGSDDGDEATFEKRLDLDVVRTQGAYLVPRPRTPVFEQEYHEKFPAALDRKLSFLEQVIMVVRRNKYHEDADEWPIGHTPPELKERRLAELKIIEEMEGITSDEDSDGDKGDEATTDGKARLEKIRPATERASWTQPQEPDGLPTPPLSADSPSPLSQGRKRRRDDEEQYPRKTRVISTVRLDVPEGDKPDGSQVKGRKRRRIDDVDDEGKGDRERPVKIRKTTFSRRKKRRLPKRPETRRSQGTYIGTSNCYWYVEHGTIYLAEVKQPLEP